MPRGLRPVLKACGSGTLATIALASTGPTPGTAISRRPMSVARALARIRRSVSSAWRFTRSSWSASSFRQILALAGTRSSASSRTISISPCSPSRPIGAISPNSAMCARIVLESSIRWRISVIRVRWITIWLCCSGLFTSTKRMLGRVTASQMASASAASFFCRFRYGFTYEGGISFTSWPSSVSRRPSGAP